MAPAAAANDRPDRLTLREIVATLRSLVENGAIADDTVRDDRRELRDDIAIVALQGLLGPALRRDPDTFALVARDAYAIADAMLTARHQPSPQEDAE